MTCSIRLTALALPLVLAACGAPAAKPAPTAPPVAAAAPAPPPADEPRILGRKPLCEASGAVFVPCASGAGRCIVVADNERAGELFHFEVRGESLVDQRALPLRADGAPVAIKDAEALTPLGDRLLLVGSHSRRSWDKKAPRCTLDEARAAFALLRRDGDAFEATAVRTGPEAWRRRLTLEGCRRDLVAVPANGTSAGLAGDVCAALADGSAHAEESQEDCARALNFEGAVGMPDGGGGERAWFGLRGPVVDGRAVALRLATTTELRFDAVATLDLAGDGVRDLAYASGWLWVLAGPSGDRMEPGSIWRVPAAAVVDGARLQPERVSGLPPLPPFSEALAIDAAAGDAFLLVDGDEEKGPGDENGCPVAARYLHLRLPRDLPAAAGAR